MAELRWLRWASVVETVSLTVLLVNLATVHHPLVTATMGPVHGFAYLATIAVAFLLPLPTTTRLRTLVPGVGGLLALRGAHKGALRGAHKGALRGAHKGALRGAHKDARRGARPAPE